MRVAAFAIVLSLVAMPALAQPSACDVLDRAMTRMPSGPAFLASYPTAPAGPLQNTAFLYDNAVATLALIGCGKPQDAARIGDAMLLGLAHDRYWHDGRLRNAYAAGPATDDPVKLAGWWDTRQNHWVEDPYQAGSDSGNMGWAMLALLALTHEGKGKQYLAGALRIAHWEDNNFDTRKPEGFIGGMLGDQPNPRAQRWKSTEHNSDLAAAFTMLAAATGDAHWRDRAAMASSFVGAMWNRKCHCFAAGMAEDSKIRSETLALDAQVFPLLALPGKASRAGAAVTTITKQFSVRGGLSYGGARDGVWTEGTEQAALLMELLGHNAEAAKLAAAADRNRSPDGFYLATDADTLSTGFDLATDNSQQRVYFKLPHLAALAWAALAEKAFNPFTGTKALPSAR